MRILWIGDATVHTGFAKCTHAVCDHLHSVGHEIFILGYHYYGDPHPYPYTIFPCYSPYHSCTDMFGIDRLPRLIAEIEPNLIILLNDPWNVQGYFEYLDWYAKKTATNLDIPKFIGWLAVDAMNQDGESINRLDAVITWTGFAKDELVNGGYKGPTAIVPLGYDNSIFKPANNKSTCREKFIPAKILKSDNGTPFIVGVVGRNQPRKRIDLSIQYFAEWINTYNISNAYLYLHIAPTGEKSCDIVSLVKYYGVSGKVILSERNAGFGETESDICDLYNCFDIYFSTSAGEGFGLPALEAMACGIPCLLPDNSAFGDWARGGSILIPCTSNCLNAPLNDRPYTIGSIADRYAAVKMLNKLYNDAMLRESIANAGLDIVKSLTWKLACEKFANVIENLDIPETNNINGRLAAHG